MRKSWLLLLCRETGGNELEREGWDQTEDYEHHYEVRQCIKGNREKIMKVFESRSCMMNYMAEKK